jgi:hypothetical protein
VSPLTSSNLPEPNAGSAVRIPIWSCSGPNPFSLETKFSFTTTTDYGKIEIYNLNGQKIVSLPLEKGESSISLDAKKFSNGIYIAKMLSRNNIIATRKLVVLK